jgi:glycerate kinase
MKIIIAPQSFKGSLTALEASKIIAQSVINNFPDSEIITIPIADGGDGTLQTLVDATDGKINTLNVHDPLQRPINAQWGSLGNKNTAVIEMARASGLALLNHDELNPLETTTYGTGELIKEAIDTNHEEIIIGIGGSATNDVGVGMASALGYKFIKKNGDSISLDASEIGLITNILVPDNLSDFSNYKILVACDVNNPLCGINGASYIYGPQKGASNQQVKFLDESLYSFSKVIEKDLNVNVLNIPGSGAAGGLGAGLMAFTGATLKPGISIVFDTLKVEEKIQNADLIITGEGQFDKSTIFDKAPIGIAKLGLKYDIPTVGLSGSIGEGFHLIHDNGISAISSIINKPMDIQTAIDNAPDLLLQASDQLMKAIKTGIKLNIKDIDG